MIRRLRFDLRYLLGPPWDTGVSPPELMEYIETNSPGRAVDIGCGTGTNVLTLARHHWNVTGLDISGLALHLARRRIAQAGCQAAFVRGDFTGDINLPNSIDLALDIGCFHGIVDRGRYLDRLTGILRPGGHWLLYAFMKRAASDAIGLGGTELEAILGHGYRLLKRSDGMERHARPSAWFLFQRAAPRAHASVDVR